MNVRLAHLGNCIPATMGAAAFCSILDGARSSGRHARQRRPEWTSVMHMLVETARYQPHTASPAGFSAALWLVLEVEPGSPPGEELCLSH